MKRHRNAVAGSALKTTWSLLVLLLLLLAGCGGSSVDDVVAGDGSSATSTATPSAAASHDPADVDTYAAANFSDIYAGLKLGNGEIELYRKPEGADQFDARIRERFSGTTFAFFDAEHSHKELQKVLERVRADKPYWRDHGVSITSILAPTDGSIVVVGTPEPDKYRDDIVRRYPDGMVKVEYEPEGQPLDGGK